MNIFLRLLPFILALELIFCYGSFAAQTYRKINVHYTQNKTGELQIQDLSHHSYNYFFEFLETEEEIEENEEDTDKKSTYNNNLYIHSHNANNHLSGDYFVSKSGIQDKTKNLVESTTPFFIMFHSWKFHI